MLLPSLLSRLLNHQALPISCVSRNGVTTLPSAETSISSSVPQKGYVFSYLVNSCGLSPEKAISASKFVQFDAPDKPNAVVKFLQEQGFTQPQITNLVAKFPVVLVYDPRRSLSPKFDFFQSTGIPKQEIPTIVSKYPDLLNRSFKRRVAPVYDYIKGIIGAVGANTLLKRGSWVFNLDLHTRLVPNVDLLREVGVPQRFIEFALLNCTSVFFSDHVEMKRVVEEVKQLGFNPLKSTFVMAIRGRIGEGSVALWDQSNGV